MMNRKVVVLQVMNRILYKTCGQQVKKYLGDPINALAHFSDFEANEVVIMDISGAKSPDFEFLQLVGKHCDMPLSYVGGIKTLPDIQTIISMGFERVLIGDAVFESMDILDDAISAFGTSTIGVMVNYQIQKQGRFLWRKTADASSELNRAYLENLAEKGVGEIVLYCISSDGRRLGYDLDVLEIVPTSTNITLCGGCSSIDEVDRNLVRYGNISFSASSVYSLLPNDSVFLKYSKDF